MSATPQEPETYRFRGFIAPQYTQIPDVVFDELAPILSGAEYKVLLYILRRTFGFKKDADSISYNQMLNGIVTRDGRRLDHGAGIKSRSTLSKALQQLEEMKIIIADRQYSEENGNETTVYRPNMGGAVERWVTERELPEGPDGDDSGENSPSTKIEPGGGTKIVPGGSPKIVPGAGTKIEPAASTENEPVPVRKSNPQETEQQKTEQQQVVALLIERGMTETTAGRLARRAGPALVEEKIAYLDFLLAVRPHQVRRPLGWLRRAIEEDYEAPEGFERVAAAFPVQEQLPLPAAREESKGRADRPPAALRRRYGTTTEELALWRDVLDRLRMTLPAAQFELFRESWLLQLGEEEAIILAPTPRVRDWLGVRLAGRIRAELARSGWRGEQVSVIVAAPDEEEAGAE